METFYTFRNVLTGMVIEGREYTDPQEAKEEAQRYVEYNWNCPAVAIIEQVDFDGYVSTGLFSVVGLDAHLQFA